MMKPQANNKTLAQKRFGDTENKPLNQTYTIFDDVSIEGYYCASIFSWEPTRALTVRAEHTPWLFQGDAYIMWWNEVLGTRDGHITLWKAEKNKKWRQVEDLCNDETTSKH